MGALEALLLEINVDVAELRAKLDGLVSPPPGAPSPVPAAGAGRARPGEPPRVPERFLLSGLVTPVEPRGNQAELDEVKERMKGLELEVAAQEGLSHNTHQ